uniref:Uncharacterized protein n=1 Tax=Octactis speculum TaxID=3111310 RepID=A0A7S2BZT7_9STRA
MKTRKKLTLATWPRVVSPNVGLLSRLADLDLTNQREEAKISSPATSQSCIPPSVSLPLEDVADMVYSVVAAVQVGRMLGRLEHDRSEGIFPVGHWNACASTCSSWVGALVYWAEGLLERGSLSLILTATNQKQTPMVQYSPTAAASRPQNVSTNETNQEDKEQHTLDANGMRERHGTVEEISSWYLGGKDRQPMVKDIQALQQMLHMKSGIEFLSVRVGTSSRAPLIATFSARDVKEWLVTQKYDQDLSDATQRLDRWVVQRVIEKVVAGDVPNYTLGNDRQQGERQGVLFRFVDPWEIEALPSGAADDCAGYIGRRAYSPLTSGAVSVVLTTLNDKREMMLGGELDVETQARCLETLWRIGQGDALLASPSLLSIRTPLPTLQCGEDLERIHSGFSSGDGGDSLRWTKDVDPHHHRHHGGTGRHGPGGHDGSSSSSGLSAALTEEPFTKSLQKQLQLNAVWKFLGLNHRCVAVMGVTLIDLKNLSPSMSWNRIEVYAILRLKHRSSSSTAALTPKTRTMDSHLTQPCRLEHREETPNDSGAFDARRPCPWGTYVRFRVPLPDDVSGLANVSQKKGARGSGSVLALTKGPPQMLHVGVYQKRPIVGDLQLGSLEVPLSALTSSTPLQQWLPLQRSGTGERNAWFLHLRVTLRFVPFVEAPLASTCDVTDAVPGAH